MNQEMRIKQLRKLIAMIDEGLLGSDWETRVELKKIRNNAIEEIKAVQQSLKDTNLLK